MQKQCYGYRANSTNPEDAARPNYVFKLPSIQSVPCPSIDNDADSVSCCRPGDRCLSNNICEYVNYQPPGYPSSYYMGACTDPSFTAKECPRICTSQVQPGAVYDSTNQQCACCGADADGESFQCSAPTDIIFTAPEPDKLTSAGNAGSNAARKKTLSTGVIAGIGAGAVIGGLVILMIVVWLLLNYSRRNRARTEAKAWLVEGKSAVNRQTPQDSVVPEAITMNVVPKHEYRIDDMLPVYSEGRRLHAAPLHAEATIPELGGRETSRQMRQRAELEACK